MARKWFQLVGEDGNAVTSADAVFVDVEDVDTLRDAVKAKCPNNLTYIDAVDLTVFANGAALNPRDSLAEFDENVTFTVQVPHRAAAMDVRGNLNRVQVKVATGELNYLLNRDPATYSLLQSPALTSGEARQILTSARSAIKSATRNAIGIREGVLLDGPLNLSQGQAKSAFYYAYSRFGGIMVAKVYGAVHKEVFQREVDVNFALGSHANIVQFLKSFSIGNVEKEQRHIIVMPFFARCAADLLTQKSPIELRALITIAHDCFEALCHIHSKKYCFADLKPANIMLHFGEQGGATLVDFGGAVRLEDPIVEVTDQYCLDVPKVTGSELLDWTCLGTTLAQLANIDITTYHSRQDLVKSLKDGHEQVDHLVDQLIISCLENPRETSSAGAFAHLLLQNMSVPIQHAYSIAPPLSKMQVFGLW